MLIHNAVYDLTTYENFAAALQKKTLRLDVESNQTSLMLLMNPMAYEDGDKALQPKNKKKKTPYV